MSRKNNGINETICGWFKRVHPEKLWAIKERPLAVTFKDMEKSMAAGQGMGAPERYRTRGFRDLSRNFSDIVAAPATIELAKLPDTVSGVSGALAVIIDVARKMQGICRRAKKNMKRLGSLYWSKLDTWDALRRAI